MGTDQEDDGFDIEDLNKLPLKSKKFLAYLISEVTWKLVLFVILFLYRDKIDYYAFFILLAIVITNGFLQIGYILGEVALDKYSRVAKTALSNKRVGGRKPRQKIEVDKQTKILIDEDDL